MLFNQLLFMSFLYFILG